MKKMLKLILMLMSHIQCAESNINQPLTEITVVVSINPDSAGFAVLKRVQTTDFGPAAPGTTHLPPHPPCADAR